MFSASRQSFVLLILLFSGAAGFQVNAQDFGSFKGEFVVKWLPDGRNMTLLNEVIYTGPNGLTWIAPKGTITDGASIPPSLWSAIGAPFSGKYRNAAVVHDHYCLTRSRKWQDTHQAFYDASRAAGVSETIANLMYYAVYRFGPRWERSRSADDPSIIIFKPKIIKSEFKEMKARIKQGQVGIEEIKKESDRSLRSLSRSIIE